MELRIILCLFVLLICAVFSAGDKTEDENEDDTFVPTHEWQVVQKGKKLPKGLHIRMNLETGITEAKLLDADEDEERNRKTALTATAQEEAGNLNEESKLSQLNDALKYVKNDYNVRSEEVLKRIDKFKTYEELKKDLEELNLNAKVDAEILKELVNKHIELAGTGIYEEDVDAILLILEDLEYLVHQYDNAIEFIALNGFEGIIYKNLNSTEQEIKKETLKLLGSSLQNNVKVKIHALETGTLHVLLRLLVLEEDLALKHRAFFALSALLRGFPYAQLKFVQNAGLSVFSKLFESKDMKLHLRLVTLVYDLLQEELSIRNDIQNQHYAAITIQQYNEVQLKKLLLEQGYCENINDLLIRCIAIDPNDHDAIEKILNALSIVADDCALKSMQKVTEVLVNLNRLYEKLAAKQSNNDVDFQYFNVLFNLTDKLVKTISKNVKSEL